MSNTVKIKTAELVGPALDWAVAKCEGEKIVIRKNELWIEGGPLDDRDTFYIPSESWEQGGPIIERERINTAWDELWKQWAAPDKRNAGVSFMAATPLIAAMRSFVASKFGDELEIPIELAPAQPKINKPR